MTTASRRLAEALLAALDAVRTTLAAVVAIDLAILATFELSTLALALGWIPGGAGWDVSALWSARAAGYAWAAWGLAHRQPAAWALAGALFALILSIQGTPLAFLNDHDSFRPALAHVGLAAVAAGVVVDLLTSVLQRRISSRAPRAPVHAPP
jgi:hypothetical protein